MGMALMLAAAVATIACAGAAEAKLRIYSSQPLFGSAEAQGRDLIAAERLALAEAGKRVAGHRIAYVALNDATAAAGRWDPVQTTANALRAKRDRHAIAYLGEYNSAASEVSLPILNRGRILQVSPANAAEQLTVPVSADPGSPGKYSPTGIRTFARVVPIERAQAEAQVAVMRQQGVTRLYTVNDGSVDGMTIAGEVAADAATGGIGIARTGVVDAKSADPAAVAAQIVASGAEGLFFGGTAQNFAISLWHELYARNPGLALFAPDGVGDDVFAASIGPGPGSRTTTTAVPLAEPAYPRLGRQFFARFRRRYGREPASYAIYGYEAMRLVLRAIERAKCATCRASVAKAVHGIHFKKSAVGRYSIDRNGDTTLGDYGLYRVEGGSLAFAAKVTVGI
jgi:branched-chain amino acid transport system substrate-binding protein